MRFKNVHHGSIMALFALKLDDFYNRKYSKLSLNKNHHVPNPILNRPFAKKNFIFFLESTIKNKLKSKISEF
jgi:hypothetical protein